MVNRYFFILSFIALTIIFSLTIFSSAQLPLLKASELSSPSDWILERQIKVYDDKVIIDLLNPIWAKFTNTNSMDPFLDEDSNAIEILP